MATLPVLSGKEVVKSFQNLGWSVARQSSSHIIMTKDGEVATLSVPDHKEVARGTVEEFNSISESNNQRIY